MLQQLLSAATAVWMMASSSAGRGGGEHMQLYETAGRWSTTVTRTATEDLHMRYQYISDFFIALAYFSIPLELIYFVKKSSVFPYRWVLVQFGAFIVLCGATHLINLWTFSAPHSAAVASVMTVAKILTAVVSCATALMLVHIIPDLLSVKTRELFLKNKAAELDREMGMMRTQEEAGRHVRMLTQEIRSSLDRHTILNTTLVELGKTLALEECALWMPTRTGLELELSHTLRQPPPRQPPPPVPLHHPSVKQALSSPRAVVVSPHSPLSVTRPSHRAKYVAGDIVAMRVPLLHLSNFHHHASHLTPSSAHDAATVSSAAASSAGADLLPHLKRSGAFALMVLMLPSDSARRWHLHELELVEVVAEQVAVALSHAAILEESIKAQELLMDRNAALDIARREAETAVRARNNFLAVMDHEMRTPAHAITAFSSLLLETSLSVEQRSMVDTILKSSNLLGTLINDVLDLSRLEDGSLQLDVRTFNVPLLFREVLNVVKPIAAVKKLSLTLHLDPDMPDYAVGDDKRLLQMTLNLMGNAIKFTKDGSVSLVACVERREFVQDPRTPEFHLMPGDDHFYLRVKVRDTGIGVNPADIPMLFNRASPGDSSGSRNYPSTGLGLPICKRFANLMDGHIWIDSQGIGHGSVITFVVKLHFPVANVDRCMDGMAQNVPLLLPTAAPCSRRTDFGGLKVLVIDDNMVNRMVTKGLLTRLGCEVTTVGSGREAMPMMMGQVAASRRLRVLFVDIFMPEMDGFEVAVRVRELFSGRADRPVMIAVTANTDVSVRERCFAVGMDGVLLKPFSLDKVKSMLNELLDRGGLVM